MDTEKHTGTQGVAAPEDASREAPKPIDPTACTDVDALERVGRGIDYLTIGDCTSARHEFRRALRARSKCMVAASMLAQMDVDPVEFLGADYRHYRVKAGESLYDIAAAHLGRPLRFWILARYNGIQNPTQLRGGDILKIPVMHLKVH